jgi:diguanylate cyclase (GGDEF)-like protein
MATLEEHRVSGLEASVQASEDPPVLVRVALVASAALLAVYAVNSIVHFGGGVDAFVNKWVYDLFPICCAGLCVAKGCLTRRERWPWLLLGLGMVLWAAGSVYYSLFLIDLKSRPIPAVSDFLWLGFYPPAYVAIVMLQRRRIERFRLSLGLDGLIAALAVGAILASVVFEEVLHSAARATTPQLLTDLAYPLGDLVLLGMVVGGLVLSGWRPGRTLALMGAGFIAFVITDSVFLYEVSNNTYTAGTIADLGWSAGPWLIALAAWQPRRPVGADPGARYVLVVPIVFGILGLGALTLMTQVARNDLAVGLAVAAMLAVMARLALTLSENLRLLARARNYDALTGALNRRRLHDALEHRLRGRGPRGRGCAVLAFDVDHFTLLNDLHGHPAGDRALVSVAEMLQERARDAVDLVGRVGGDEFAVVLADTRDEEAHVFAEGVRRSLREHDPAGVRVSVGMTVVADAGDLSADDVLLAAESALYDAKERGGDQVQSFSGEPSASLALVAGIKAALAEDRFVLNCQPMVDLRTGLVEHSELLIRMITRDGDIVPPGAFLPTAERFDLITDIDRWVVTRALDLAASGMAVAVNLSARSIADPMILASVTAAADRGLDASRVIFEITETAATSNIQTAKEFAHALTTLGYALALDDFGTGFGTFTYIKHLPARYLKIDMDFVRGATDSKTDLEVIKSIVAIAHSLGLLTIAEGIESQEVLDLMRELGVDLGQGFHIGRPEPLPGAFVAPSTMVPAHDGRPQRQWQPQLRPERIAE